jgi:deoxyribose-phosphate aldolase
MDLTVKEIARMIDLSCVRTDSSLQDIRELVAAAKQYEFGQVSILQCFIPETRQLLEGTPGIHLVGNVSFPSGSDSTAIKVAQAKEMVATGCDEIDMVINVGRLRSGQTREVAEDVEAVVASARPLPVKVILEVPYLNPDEIAAACEICIAAGAAFVKTGSGWAPRGTTVEDVRLIKSIVGDRIRIKASGGIRSLATLTAMVEAGASRFGVNLKSGLRIVEEALPKTTTVTAA